MDILVSIFRLCAGIGLFMFAMYLIEESLKNLSGRNFKLFLQRITKNTLGAVAGGAIVTAVLQSSSMVSLMVLAFVGAGVFTLKNAIAIILGANLGTILASWVIATVGFKMNIEVIAYPAVFIGGMMLILYGKQNSIRFISYFLLGFGLLFIGLAFMKTAMESQVQAFDFSKYENMPLIIFLLIGFVITLLVQSSSVTMALTLSALYFGAVSFPAAAAIVLGAETGTTIKLLFSAIGGNASKKRVVTGSILFNIFLTIFAFIFLTSIVKLITDILNIRDPLIGLVTFSTFINLASILIFLPFLGPFTKLLEQFFKKTDELIASFIGQAKVQEAESALELFKKETEYFIYYTMLFNEELFHANPEASKYGEGFEIMNKKRNFSSKTIEEEYDFLKQLQGEIQAFYVKLRPTLPDTDSAQLSLYVSSVRSAMYAAKCLHDIERNIDNTRKSSKEIKFNFFLNSKEQTLELYSRLLKVMQQKEKPLLGILSAINSDIQNNYSDSLNSFYHAAQHSPLENMDITTTINLNRELFTSNKAILMSVKDFLLNESEATEFNEELIYKT